MDGKIGFKSTSGQGSTFWAEFPAFEAEATTDNTGEEVARNKELQEQHQISGTILYIEDNATNLLLMEKIIKKIGACTFIPARSAEQGLEIAQEHLPDLILMDINLPGMDGISALKFLANHDETHEIPVVAVSAAATKRDIENGIAHGFKAYLTKPFDMQELIQVIKTQLGA